MAEDRKVTRLSKAAREFNVGITTIVEFLHKKGVNIDPNPNTKLPEEAYALLVKEYSSDISVKKESEKLMLKELHRKKESLSIDDVPSADAQEEEAEEEIIIKGTAAKPVDFTHEVKKPDIKLVGKIDLEKQSKPAAPQPEIKEPEAVKPEEAQPVAEKQVVTPEPVEPKAEEKKPEIGRASCRERV